MGSLHGGYPGRTADTKVSEGRGPGVLHIEGILTRQLKLKWVHVVVCWDAQCRQPGRVIGIQASVAWRVLGHSPRRRSGGAAGARAESRLGCPGALHIRGTLAVAGAKVGMCQGGPGAFTQRLLWSGNRSQSVVGLKCLHVLCTCVPLERWLEM